MNFDRELESRTHDTSLGVFSAGQRAAYDTIVNSIENGEGSNTFFLQGPAGTGKTFLYRTLCNRYRSQGKVVLCVASCGIAASLLPNGRTAHSQFRIPLECTETSTCNDEVTMQLKYHLSAVDKLLRDITGRKTQLFGGIPVLLGGDFAQILPVESVEVVTNYAAFSDGKYARSEWRGEPTLCGLVIEVVLFPRLSYTPDLQGDVDIPDWMKSTDDGKVFREFFYPEQLLEANDTSIFHDRAILASTNDS
ncbi:hypothetical protein EPUL_004563, partial [Erysiphe pulchra]